MPIAALEASPDPERLLRVHRSRIVNVKQVQELETRPQGEYVVVLEGGTKLQSSRSYTDKLKRWVANPF